MEEWQRREDERLPSQSKTRYSFILLSRKRQIWVSFLPQGNYAALNLFHRNQTHDLQR
jgi:hypothetical protein